MNEALKYYYRNLLKIKQYFLIYPVSKSGFKAVDKKTMRSFNKFRFHGPKRLVCYNPFSNLYFNSRGQGVACCRNQKTVFGTYPEDSIKNIWFGETANKLRKHILHNDLSFGCEYCDHQLKTGRFSGLPSMHVDRYAGTKPKYPKILELELSNECNLECIMCSGIVSSSIRKNRENKNKLNTPYDQEFVEQLEEFLPHAKEICFYGGEPFLIKLYFKIWEKLLKQKSRAKLHVVTNGTIYNQKIEHLLKNLRFTVSVSFDAMDKLLFEEIRQGANFQIVKQNISKINNILGKKGLSLSMTPLKKNRFEVPKVIDYCNSLNATINLSFVENPYQLALWTLNSSELAELEKYYLSYRFTNSSNYNANYNKQVYKQFISQINLYKIRNRKLEKNFENSLVKSTISIKRQEKWNNYALRKKLLSENELIRIKEIIDELLKNKTETEKSVFNKQYADFLETKGEEAILNIKSKEIDFKKVENKFKEFTKLPNIYRNSYL